MSDPVIGQVLGGRYQVVRRIGQGGMGTIYEARHLKMTRSFALKVLAAEVAADQEAVARFRREGEAVARLRHPHVVEIIDWEVLEDGSPALVMELLNGENLAQRIARGPLQWSFLAAIADQVLSALMAAHRAGIVHRDLKPQNIFLSEDDLGEQRAKLLDFGIAKVRDTASLTSEDKLIGTPSYMSPEQADAQSSSLGPETDVWAMGAILFEMATAKRAFAAPSTPAVLYRICHGEPQRLHDLRADAPTAFVKLVARTLSRGPDRLRDIESLRVGLRAALAQIAPGATAEPLRSATSGEVPLVAAAATPASRAVDVAALGSPTTLSRATGQAGARKAPARRLLLMGVLVGAGLAVGVTVAVRGFGGGDDGGRSGQQPGAAPPPSPVASPAAAPETSPAASPAPVATTVVDAGTAAARAGSKPGGRGPKHRPSASPSPSPSGSAAPSVSPSASPRPIGIE